MSTDDGTKGQREKQLTFSGEDSEFPSWSFVMGNHLRRHAEIGSILEAARKSGQILSEADFPEATSRASQLVMADLSMYCKDKAQRFLMNLSENGNGLEAWRALHAKHEGGGPTMLRGRINAILQFKFGAKTLDTYMDRLTVFDSMVTLYEKNLPGGEKLNDDVKLSTAVDGAYADLRTQLINNSDKYQSYDELYHYVQQMANFNRPYVIPTAAKAGKDPNQMEIDALGKGKNKGKKGDKSDKSKGKSANDKSNNKGKDKSKGDKNKS
jgi:hypothetical protein